MYSKWLVAFFVSIGLALVSSQNNVTIQSTNVTTVTTVSPNTTTTPVPTTTSTSKPSTTASPTTTTPVSTTTLKPTSPPTPPKPESWNGNFTDHELNKTCINLRFAVQIDIAYNNTNGTEWLTGFTIPTDASIDLSKSHCSKNDTEKEVIAINFANEEHTSANLTLTFNKTDNEVRVEAVELSFILTKEIFPDFHEPSLYNKVVNVGKNDLTLFKVASAHSYVCAATQSADLGGHSVGLNDVKINFLESKVEAYIGDSKKGVFDPEIDCKSTEISDVVPIAVGAALAGLVVIVLIAYFIGRRRSRRLAYQSV
jgi:lysosomal-associated membrane protein 1/2